MLAGVALYVAGCGEPSDLDRLISRLRKGNTASRLKAISDAEARPNSEIRAELLQIFDNQREEPLVRGAAALALGRMREQRLPARAVQRLPNAILAAGKPGALQTEAFILAKALTAYGPESLDTVSALLKYPRKEVVAWAIAHHGLYRRSDRSLLVLSNYLGSAELLYRRSAAYGLAQTFHPNAESLVLKRLADLDPEVRYHLAWGLANYGSSQGLAAAEAQLAREKDPRVKTELRRAVAEIRSRELPVAPRNKGR